MVVSSRATPSMSRTSGMRSRMLSVPSWPRRSTRPCGSGSAEVAKRGRPSPNADAVASRADRAAMNLEASAGGSWSFSLLLTSLSWGFKQTIAWTVRLLEGHASCLSFRRLDHISAMESSPAAEDAAPRRIAVVVTTDSKAVSMATSLLHKRNRVDGWKQSAKSSAQTLR